MRITRVAFALIAVAAGSAVHAATYTTSSDQSTIFGAAAPTNAFDGSSFSNGVSFSVSRRAGDLFFESKGVTTGLNAGVFSDVVTDDTNDGHDWTVFSFSAPVTAFGAIWSPYFKNFSGATGGLEGSLNGAGLRIDIGNDGTYEAEFAGVLHTTTNNTWIGFKSSEAFSSFRISYQAVAPNQETYQLSNLQFAAAVPEPETYAMMLAGLGVLGALARRRKA